MANNSLCLLNGNDQKTLGEKTGNRKEKWKQKSMVTERNVESLLLRPYF